MCQEWPSTSIQLHGICFLSRAICDHLSWILCIAFHCPSQKFSCLHRVKSDKKRWNVLLETLLEMPASRNVTLWASGHPGGTLMGNEGTVPKMCHLHFFSSANGMSPNVLHEQSTQWDSGKPGGSVPCARQEVVAGGGLVSAQVTSFYDSRIKEALLLLSIALQQDHTRQNQTSVKGKRTK